MVKGRAFAMKKIAIGIIVVVAWIGLMLLTELMQSAAVPVALPTLSVYGNESFVWVQGTWTIEGEKHAFPLQTTEVTCSREDGVCRSATAEITSGMGVSMLNVRTETFNVTSWNEDSVVYVDTSPTCVYYIHTINPRIKSVTGIRKKLPPERQSGDCSALDDELRLTMKDGGDITSPMLEESKPWFADLAFAPLTAFFKILEWFS